MRSFIERKDRPDTDMNPPSIFLKDIRNSDYLASLSTNDRASIEQFLEDTRRGPGDGEIDIEWQEACRGYYAHLEYLYSLTDPEAQALYRESLRKDIETWISESPGNSTVKAVRDQVFDDG